MSHVACFIRWLSRYHAWLKCKQQMAITSNKQQQSTRNNNKKWMSQKKQSQTINNSLQNLSTNIKQETWSTTTTTTRTQTKIACTNAPKHLLNAATSNKQDGQDRQSYPTKMMDNHNHNHKAQITRYNQSEDRGTLGGLVEFGCMCDLACSMLLLPDLNSLGAKNQK